VASTDTYELSGVANATPEERGSALKAELRRLCEGRDLSPEARCELDALLAGDDHDAILDAVRQLRHIPVVRSDPVDGCADTTALLWERLEAREQRITDFEHRVGGVAYNAGRQLARHEITNTAAKQRCAAVTSKAACMDHDLDDVVWLIPPDVADAIATDAFLRGYERGQS
jgi:hypothetical protein